MRTKTKVKRNFEFHYGTSGHSGHSIQELPDLPFRTMEELGGVVRVDFNDIGPDKRGERSTAAFDYTFRVYAFPSKPVTAYVTRERYPDHERDLTTITRIRLGKVDETDPFVRKLSDELAKLPGLFDN